MKNAVCGFLCLVMLVVALVLGTSSGRDHSRKAFFSGHFTAASSKEGRKIYPLSVIYGGAYSPEELNRARRLDSVVGLHYADFGKTSVVQRTPGDLFMYVSYRKSDQVYWTKSKRRIPKGESVLSDGEHLARVRCGNRLSFVPRQPTLPEKEGSEEALNTPESPQISVPFDAPPSPAIEADLYVPANPLLSDLFSPAAPPFAAVPAASAAQPVTSSGLGGGEYAPRQMSPSGSSFGGIPFGGTSGLPSRNSGSGSGISVAVPLVISTPEPSAIKLQLVSFFVCMLFGWGGRAHSSKTVS